MTRNLLLLPLVFLLASAGAADPVPGPKTILPEQRSLPRVVAQPGSVQAEEETPLHARIPGYVEAVHADIGQKVKAGDVLVTLHVPELVAEAKAKQALIARAEAEVNQARKAQAAAKANAEAVEATIAETKAALTRTEANRQRWTSENDRTARLVQQGILDAQTRDETQNQLRAAQAAHDEATARVTSARAQAARANADHEKAVADVEAVAAQLEVAKAEAARVEALLDYRKITAPYAGIVTRRNVSTGDFVQPTTTRMDALFTLAKTNPVRIVIQVPEADAGLVTKKSPVTLSIPALKGPAIETTVTRSAWALDPVSRTLRVEIDRANNDDRLRPGMYVIAQIAVELPEIWTLPVSAVVKQGDERVCFVVQGDKVVRTVVQVGATDGKFVQILRLGQAEPTGRETIARDATGLTDGAAAPR